jgi:hypothetical protein
MRKNPTYSTFRARVYKVANERKNTYVYYEWMPEKGGKWTRTNQNGFPFTWVVPQTAEGDEAYQKLAKQFDNAELELVDDAVNINPPVDFEVTMKREHRGQYADEYVWTFSHRISPKLDTNTTPFEEFFSDD